jgi:hypothetical protein
MFFKDWLNLSEAKTDYDAMFSQRDKTQKSDVSSLLGFKKPLVKFSQGSLATLYQHPTNKNLLIKITSHKEDVNNIVKAQRVDSPNVVKTFPWDKEGTLIKSLPSLNSLAIIVEKVNGTPMVYTNNDFLGLGLNGSFEKAADWLLGTILKEQEAILNRYNKNDVEEHYKLISLFKTLSKLTGREYRIELSDFDQNILDTGDRYVIVDMGF